MTLPKTKVCLVNSFAWEPLPMWWILTGEWMAIDPAVSQLTFQFPRRTIPSTQTLSCTPRAGLQQIPHMGCYCVARTFSPLKYEHLEGLAHLLSQLFPSTWIPCLLLFPWRLFGLILLHCDWAEKWMLGKLDSDPLVRVPFFNLGCEVSLKLPWFSWFPTACLWFCTWNISQERWVLGWGGEHPRQVLPHCNLKKKAQQSEQWRPAWDDLRSFRSPGVWANLLFRKDLGRLKGFNKYLLDLCIVLGWWMMWSLFLPSWTFCL